MHKRFIPVGWAFSPSESLDESVTNFLNLGEQSGIGQTESCFMSPLVEDPVSPPRVSGSDRPAAGRHSENEFQRKFLHMLPGCLPFLLAFLPHDDPPDWIAMAIVTAIAFVLTGTYILMRSRVSRPNEHDFYTTTLSYPAAVLGTMLLFPSHIEFAMVVVILLAFGDGFAYIFGKRFGKRRLPWNPEKSWAGTFAFVLFSAPIASLAFWLEAKNPDVSFALAAACCTIAATLAALAESWPTKLTDNLRVGVTAAIAVSASYFLLAPYWG
jgi:dolichol kinase